MPSTVRAQCSTAAACHTTIRTMLDDHVRPVWHALAECRGNISTLYIDGKGPGAYDAARMICVGCPVLSDCRAEGDELETSRWAVFGFRAGESPKERIGRRRAMRKHPTAV